MSPARDVAECGKFQVYATSSSRDVAKKKPEKHWGLFRIDRSPKLAMENLVKTA